MSAGLSMAAMIRAARTIFSLVKVSGLGRAMGTAPVAIIIAAGVETLRFYSPGLANIDHVDPIRTSLP